MGIQFNYVHTYDGINVKVNRASFTPLISVLLTKLLLALNILWLDLVPEAIADLILNVINIEDMRYMYV